MHANKQTNYFEKYFFIVLEIVEPNLQLGIATTKFLHPMANSQQADFLQSISCWAWRWEWLVGINPTH